MKNARMTKYYGKIPKPSMETSSNLPNTNETIKRSREEVELSEDEIVGDPALRKPINDYSVNIREEVVDLLLNEMNKCFTKSNSELLTCIACLDPIDSFQSFDRQKLLRLAELYSEDFTQFDLVQLKIQLDRYISSIRSNEAFSGLQDIG
ncbi:uncharacterized protein LOC118484058 [Helianthus annuus]|uniref:uncharacterized protein LOC118484058 n=1 Tax=Helianthus annuus TaxID=4232 RepID=UPI001652EF6F|nr:uncharacterized protein LOC118484058 [Helianthus annuus]